MATLGTHSVNAGYKIPLIVSTIPIGDRPCIQLGFCAIKEHYQCRGEMLTKPVDSNGSPLDLSRLCTDFYPGITKSFGSVLRECAEHCLYHHKHEQGVSLEVMGDWRKSYKIKWETPNLQSLRCYGDKWATTEHAAYGLAILLAVELLGFTIHRRSARGNGFDFWLAPQNPNPEGVFQECAALEVSGILEGAAGDVVQRHKEKCGQSRESTKFIEVYVAVVEFSKPQARVAKNENR